MVSIDDLDRGSRTWAF